MPGTYLTIDAISKRALNVPSFGSATPFHIRTTNDGNISGIEQLAFNTTSRNSSSPVEFGAWI
jgi:hypothetical protein